jgi:di/tricarboxylate transporter
MRAALAVAIALLISGPACAEEAASAFADAPNPMQVAQATGRADLATSQRANVPRTGGTGLAGIPSGAAGLSSTAAATVGVLLAIGVIAAVAIDDDDDAPAGTGSGSN